LNGNGSVVSINNKLKQMGVNSQTEIQDSIDGSQLGKSPFQHPIIMWFYLIQACFVEPNARFLFINLDLQ